MAGANVTYQTANTLNRLDLIENERDKWQRPSEIIQALSLRDGSAVADLGCGSGYFTLKLSSEVGERGRVLGVDLRKPSLFFLWMRTVLRHQHNVSIVQATPDDPRLGPKVDAVLVVNTYHELTQAKAVLDHILQSLVSGGRLVIADRTPQYGGPDPQDHHEIAATLVEEQLTRKGFEVLSRRDTFLEQPGDGPWWLIVARKP